MYISEAAKLAAEQGRLMVRKSIISKSDTVFGAVQPTNSYERCKLIVFKEDERGVAIVCREMEIMRNQAHEEGVEQGSIMRLIKQVCAKMQKFSSVEEIADDLVERDVPLIQKIMDVAPDFAPDYNADAIYKALNLQSCRNSLCGETLQQKIFP